MKIVVHGTPGAQGSKRYVGNGVMVESSAKVKPWREAVKWATLNAMEISSRSMLRGPIKVSVAFVLVRPKSCPRYRRYPDKTPDIDKILRSTFDALTDAGVWEDDARVVECFATKRFPVRGDTLDVPGCVITVEEMT